MPNAASPDPAPEAPLDAAAERIRRRLVRFAVINIGILFAAVIVVLAAIVYKTVQLGNEPAAAASSDGGMRTGEIALPAGARIVSQALSGSRVTLLVELAGGGQAIFVYDLAAGRIVGRHIVTTE